MTDEELEKVARAATPGPWETTDMSTIPGEPFLEFRDGEHRAVLGDPFTMDEENKAFISAFNPATALDLLRRLRVADEALASSLRVGLEACQRAENAEARVKELEDLTVELKQEAKEAFKIGRLLG